MVDVFITSIQHCTRDCSQNKKARPVFTYDMITHTYTKTHRHTHTKYKNKQTNKTNLGDLLKTPRV